MASTVTELLRRRFGGKKDDGYIKDGLIFHLDGIDKGTTDTTKWVDLVGGIVFTEANGNDCHGDNCIIINNTNYLLADRQLSYPRDSYTVEGVVDNRRGWGGILVGNPNTAYLLFNADAYVCFDNLVKAKLTTVEVSNHTISANASSILVNGESKTLTGGGWNSQTGVARVGCLNLDGQYKLGGSIYAIRVYNRLLTADEMLHNQRVDNERFELGLTI